MGLKTPFGKAKNGFPAQNNISNVVLLTNYCAFSLLKAIPFILSSSLSLIWHPNRVYIHFAQLLIQRPAPAEETPGPVEKEVEEKEEEEGEE